MSWKAIPALALTCAAVAVAGCGSDDSGSDSGASAPSKVTVSIKDFKYVPETITVKKGGAVTWTNEDDAPHTATADDKTTFDTGDLMQGDSKTLTFDEAGTFKYLCLFHAFMTGTVVVQ